MKNNEKINTADTLWKLVDVSKNGVNRKRLENVSIEIDSGVTAVIGPSGSGKSSFLNIIVEFEKPDSGKVISSDRTEPFFWVPQNLGLWHHMTVGDHLDAMMEKTEKGIVDDMLEKFEILDKKNVFPSQLSQGEKSRLAMARALVAAPSVLIMDEPLINIDPAKQLLFWDIVVEVAKNQGISLLYATHSPKHVIGTAENVICMRDGGIIYSGSVEELYHSPPDLELAEYLGDVNWIEEKDKFILPEGPERSFPLKLRPEQVALKKVPKGAFIVIESIFRGEIAKSLIEHKSSSKSFEIFHRPSSRLQTGERVEIEIR